jgi:hypothetical protein
VAAVGMRDGVPANRAGATLKPYDLALKAIIARQDDAATVQKREEIAELQHMVRYTELEAPDAGIIGSNRWDGLSASR